jgi:cytochrome P450
MQTKPPSPKSNPLLGHLLFIYQDSLSFINQLRDMGDITSFRLGWRTLYFVNHPDYISQVIQSNKFVRTPLSRKLLGSFLGDSVFSQEGELHLQQRRLMQPAFHRERLAGYGQIMIDATTEMLQTWQDGQTRSIVEEMTRVTLEIVSKSLFGSSRNREADAVGEALALVQDAIDSEYELYSVLPGWIPVRRSGKYKKAVDTIQQVTRKIVEERRQEGKDHGDLLSMLLLAKDEDGSTMTDEQVCGQVLSMLFAGHETTANTMCWTWYLLALNPHVRQKLHQELDTVLAGRTPTLADLPHLKYTEMVIKESQRKYPSAWWAERTPLEDVEMGGYLVKKGTPVVVSVYATHNDARFFPNPDQFIPERFSPENAESIPRFAYLPFGAGAHQCIGNGFAMMETRLMLAYMAQKFELSLEEGYQPQSKPVVTLGFRNELPMVIHERKTAVDNPILGI